MEIRSFQDMRDAVENQKRKTAVVAAANDIHTLEAVFRAEEDGLLDYVLIGSRPRIAEIAGSLGHEVADDRIIDSADNVKSARLAVDMINNGRGDFIVKGFMQTAELLHEVVDREHGIGTGRRMSHVAVVEIPGYHKLLAVTDGGMIPAPTLDAKRDIIENAVHVHRCLGFDRPKVAVCCASEQVSAKIPETTDAAELTRMNEQGIIKYCIVDGPVSLDIAMSAHAASLKGYGGPVGGDADIIVVPNITAGNIFVKGLLMFAGARMTGGIVGAKCPVALNSRGASFEEKYYSLLLCAL